MPRAPPVITATLSCSSILVSSRSPRPDGPHEQARAFELETPPLPPHPEAGAVLLEAGLHHRPGAPAGGGGRIGPVDPFLEVDDERYRLLTDRGQTGRLRHRSELAARQRARVRRVAQALDRLVVRPLRRIVRRPHVLDYQAPSRAQHPGHL